MSVEGLQPRARRASQLAALGRTARVCATMLAAHVLTPVSACVPRPTMTRQCEMNSECAAGFVCVTGMCRAQCAEDRDCHDPTNPASLALRCITPSDSGGGTCTLPDGGAESDSAVDGRSDTAVGDSAPADVRSADATPDAPATPCAVDAGMATCGDACVDLRTDPLNCGACGYRVTSIAPTGSPGHRDCIAGAPTPAWRPLSTSGAPSARHFAYSAASNDEVLVWGGRGTGTVGTLADGARYHPATNRWLPMAAAPVGLAARQQNSAGEGAQWTGRSMILWGGASSATGPFYANGGVYTPPAAGTTDLGTWDMLPDPPGAFAGRIDHYVAWDGTSLHVFGGYDSSSVPRGDGTSLDVARRIWTPMDVSTFMGSSAVIHGCVTWMVDRMAIWGGVVLASGNDARNNGNYFSPSPIGGTWRRIPNAVETPAARSRALSVYMQAPNREWFIWGGVDRSANLVSSGAGISADSDTWRPTSTTNAPTGRYAVGVWTGRYVLIWGGLSGAIIRNDGAAYDPRTNIWHPIATEAGVATARYTTTAHWVQATMELVIWGGTTGVTFEPTGGAYQPPFQYR